MSGSDDFTLSCWDLLTETNLFTLNGHKDQVRSGIISPSSEHIWASGSHDHTVKMWDTRSQECISTLEHSEPVEDVLILPSGGLLISVAGIEIKIWDITGGFRCLETISTNQKTITSLAYDPVRSRLFTASLDSSVKVFDISNYKIVHVIKYPAPILTMGVSPNHSHLVVGMSDGMLSIRHRVVQIEKENYQRSFALPDIQSSIQTLPLMTKKYLNRGIDSIAQINDFKIERIKKQKLKPYDKFLKKFQYKRALDSALETKNPITITSLLEEFIRRQSLKIPLSGRNEVTLKPIVIFLIKNCLKPEFMSTLIPVANKLLDLFSSTIGLSPSMDKLYFKLQSKINKEIRYQKQLLILQGIFDCLFSANSLSNRKIKLKNQKNQEIEAENSALLGF